MNYKYLTQSLLAGTLCQALFLVQRLTGREDWIGWLLVALGAIFCILHLGLFVTAIVLRDAE